LKKIIIKRDKQTDRQRVRQEKENCHKDR